MDQSIYIEYQFAVDPLVPGVEILIAELGEVGFESFVETDRGVNAYIQKTDMKDGFLEAIQILKSSEFRIEHTSSEIAPVNWNETWESNFKPIIVDGICTVRAPFHEQASTRLEVIIEPKMSFGTGHHESTHMMIQYLLKEDLSGKTILDMGCGTGVLAIIAEKMGASAVMAIDIDPWSYENSLENTAKNNSKIISVIQGDASSIKGKSFDLIMANINRNILLKDMHLYAEALNDKGTLLLSGFYKEDIPLIKASCDSFMLKLEQTIERGQWVALKFIN